MVFASQAKRTKVLLADSALTMRSLIGFGSTYVSSLCSRIRVAIRIAIAMLIFFLVRGLRHA
jgi:hypothetical protein